MSIFGDFFTKTSGHPVQFRNLWSALLDGVYTDNYEEHSGVVIKKIESC